MLLPQPQGTAECGGLSQHSLSLISSAEPLHPEQRSPSCPPGLVLAQDLATGAASGGAGTAGFGCVCGTSGCLELEEKHL